MESKLFYTFIMVVFGLFFLQAQTRSTKETKVVLLVNKSLNNVTGIILFDAKNAEHELPTKYPKSIFYLGVLKGSFELIEDKIEPKSGATITMYTNKQLFANDHFSPGEVEDITIGKFKTKVISSKKGELILKTY